MDDITIGILLAVGQFVLVAVLSLLSKGNKKSSSSPVPQREDVDSQPIVPNNSTDDTVIFNDLKDSDEDNDASFLTDGHEIAPPPIALNDVIEVPIVADDSNNYDDDEGDDTAFLTDQYEVTGYRRLYNFSLAGACYQSERGKALSRSLHAGDPVQLVPEPYNPKDRKAIAVHVEGERIGYVMGGIASRIYGRLFDGFDVGPYICQVLYSEINPGYDTPKMMLSVFVKDDEGTDTLISDRTEPNYIYVEPIEGCGVDHVDDILHRGYLLVPEAKQMIYSHPEWYKRITTADPAEMKAEDDDFFTDFVRRLYSGGITYDTDVDEFIKSVRDERTVGTSRVLSRRIKQYLTIRGIGFQLL